LGTNAIHQPWRTGVVGEVTNIRVNSQLFGEGVGTLGGGDIEIRAGREHDLESIDFDAAAIRGRFIARLCGSPPW
jgi:hypothetical protein